MSKGMDGSKRQVCRGHQAIWCCWRIKANTRWRQRSGIRQEREMWPDLGEPRGFESILWVMGSH